MGSPITVPPIPIATPETSMTAFFPNSAAAKIVSAVAIPIGQASFAPISGVSNIQYIIVMSIRKAITPPINIPVTISGRSNTQIIDTQTKSTLPAPNVAQEIAVSIMFCAWIFRNCFVTFKGIIPISTAIKAPIIEVLVDNPNSTINSIPMIAPTIDVKKITIKIAGVYAFGWGLEQ